MYECKIAEKLVELRTLKGVTQENLAQSLSVSNRTISKWENGVSTPDLSMLVELAKYYGVTTDSLLGLCEDKKQSTKEEVSTWFKCLDRKDSVLKAFEVSRSIIPAIYETISEHRYDVNDNENVFSQNISQYHRSNISLNEFFNFTVASEDVNIAVMMLRNKSNFAWLKDPEKQKKIVKLFKFLSNEDALLILHFINSTVCSDNFTADYIARNTGLQQERVCEILDEFCTVGECNYKTAHIAEGEIKVYGCFGDGIILSLIALAFEQMCGTRIYQYNFSGRCKMIGGK